MSDPQPFVPINVNTGDIETEFPIAPDGKYRCRLIKFEYRRASTGTPGVNLTFKPVDEIPGFDGNFFRGLWFSAKAMWMVKRDIEAILADDWEEELNLNTEEEFQDWVMEFFGPLVGDTVWLVVGQEVAKDKSGTPKVNPDGTPKMQNVVQELQPDDGSQQYFGAESDMPAI